MHEYTRLHSDPSFALFVIVFLTTSCAIPPQSKSEVESASVIGEHRALGATAAVAVASLRSATGNAELCLSRPIPIGVGPLHPPRRE